MIATSMIMTIMIIFNMLNRFLSKTIDLIKKLSSVKRYRKKVSIGASAGGIAAILFGHLLNFSKVIAFNPQTVISEEKETIINDTFYTLDVCKKLRNLNPDRMTCPHLSRRTDPS